jgi:uncharacterized membrane protein
MKQQASIEIGRPINEVFAYTNDHVPEWSLTVVEDEVVDEKPDGVGTTFRCVTEDHGKRMEFDGVVTRRDPPTLSAIHMAGKQFDIDAEYTFEDLGDRTRVTLLSTVTPKGFLKVVFLLFGWAMNKAGCKAMQNELDNLKRLLEKRADGTSAQPIAG